HATLSIAKQFKVPFDDLLAANKAEDPHQLKIGQKLVIPVKKTKPKKICIVHRKSAYFLFLAVLGMLVIGIVMLFSTSAFAKDSHGDMYFFVKRQAIW